MDLEETILSSDSPVLMIGNNGYTDGLSEELNALNRKYQNSESDEITLIGNKGCGNGTTRPDSAIQTLAQHFISLYRRHKLAANERRTILSHASHLLVVQLCLSEFNKQKHDISEVDISEVLLTSKKITEQKLSTVRASCLANRTSSSQSVANPSESANQSNPIEATPSTSANQSNLIDAALSKSANQSAEEMEVMKLYEAMLKRCNMVDLVDVVRRVGEWMRGPGGGGGGGESKEGETGQKEMRKRKYILMQLPEDESESTMLDVLSGKDGPTSVQVLDVRSNESHNSPGEEGDAGVKVMSSMVKALSDILPGDIYQGAISATPKTPSTKSATEVFTRQLIFAHLALIINTRDEISLAHCLSLPDKGMGIEGFTALRKAALEKKMPMYPTMVSFIMKLRLGGKSYRPDTSSPLGTYVKPMGEFITLIQSIHTLAEETTDIRVAIKKILSAIKSSILKSKGNILRPGSVEKVIGDMCEESEILLDPGQNKSEKTPKKIVGQGRVIYGQKTINVIRSMVDRESGAFMSRLSRTRMLTDTLTSQKTPVRVPCIASQFRTPTAESDPDSPENVSLRERLRKSLGDQSEQPNVVSLGHGAKSFMLWAEPAVKIGIDGLSDTPTRDVANSDASAVIHGNRGLWAFSPDDRPVPTTRKETTVGGVRTLSPDLIDSIVATPTLKRHLAVESPPPCEPENESTNRARKSNKRKKEASKKRLVLGEVCDEASQPAKKAKKVCAEGPKQTKKAKATGPKPKKKKEITLAKGQKTLAHFFRV